METIGGYRIVRRLGSGSRSEVFLGHSGVTGPPALAAIKVFRPRVDERSIDGEIAALSRLQHPHVVRLLDLATGPGNTPCLVLQHLVPGGLPRLLAERSDLGPGEAVTILAPLLSAVTAMHQAGVVHGNLGTHAVLFDDSGAPALSGFGAAAVIEPPPGGHLTPAVLDGDPRVVADREAVTRFVASTLARVRPSAPEALDLLRLLQHPGTTTFSDLERRLFDLAPAQPVQFGPDSPAPAVPHRFDLGAGVPADGEQDGVERRSGWLHHSALPPQLATWVSGLLEQLPSSVGARLSSVAESVRSVRRGVWVVAAIGLGAVITTVAVSLGEAPEADGSPLGNDAPPAAQEVVPAAPPVATGDDPVEAANALLERRAKCLSDRSIVCLDAVHAPGSAAWKADAARIEAVQDGGELASDNWARAHVTEVIDRMGDTVLLGVETPESTAASVLMVRTEAGWRFRSLGP